MPTIRKYFVRQQPPQWRSLRGSRMRVDRRVIEDLLATLTSASGPPRSTPARPTRKFLRELRTKSVANFSAVQHRSSNKGLVTALLVVLMVATFLLFLAAVLFYQPHKSGV